MPEEYKNSKKKKAEEDLIAKSPGYGYLKVPQEVRKLIEDKYSKKVSDYPNPDAFFVFKDGRLELTYEIDFEEER